MITIRLRSHTLVTFVLGAIVLVTVGCSGEAEFAPVRGRVFYRDKPLTSGVVMFQPPKGPPASGTIQPDGTFELKTIGTEVGARIGTNRVRISSRETWSGDKSEIGLGRLITPKRYDDITTSNLTAEVKAGEHSPFEFRLTD